MIAGGVLMTGCVEANILRAMHNHAFGPPPMPPLPRPAALQALRSILAKAQEDDDLDADKRTGMGAMYERAATEGELEEEGVEQLLNLLDPPPTAVFADLGSGRGEALFHIAARRPLAHVIGIELLPARHERARTLLAALEDQRPEVLRAPVTLIEGDLMDLGWEEGMPDKQYGGMHGVTHAFMCSTCFDDVILAQVARTLGSHKLCPAFQALVSIRELPSQPFLQKVGELTLCCSWNAASRARVYVPTDLLSRPPQAWAVPVLSHFLCADDVCSLPRGLGCTRSAPLIRLHT